MHIKHLENTKLNVWGSPEFELLFCDFGVSEAVSDFSEQRYAQVTTVKTEAHCKNKCEGKKRVSSQPARARGSRPSVCTSSRYSNK